MWPTTHSPPASSASSDLSSKAIYPIIHFVNYDKFLSLHRHFLASVTVEIEPTRYFNAVSHPKWRSAMKQEIETLEKNGTWTLTSLSPDK